MASEFIIYDLAFLVVFAAFLFIFLYSRRKNLKKDGLLILYRTKWGINLINKIGKNFPRTLDALSYVSIATGYILMAAVVYMIAKVVYIYATLPSVVRAIKVPPLIPLVPYLPQVFKLSFLPPFYFTFWIITIAIIAISHEMAHGIFMRRYNVKIKSTGFAFFPYFFPIFPAAFVEQDEKSMEKSNKFQQMTILSAGTFANILTAILFFGVLWIFFSLSFSASGVIFDTYPYTSVNVSSVNSVNGINLESPSYNSIIGLAQSNGLNVISAGGISYVATKEFLEGQDKEGGSILLYYDAPAIDSNLENVILGIDGKKISSLNELQNEISSHNPGDKITVEVLGADSGSYSKDVILNENPFDKNVSWLGIGFSSQENSRLLGKVYSFANFKKPHIYYKPNFEAGLFIYNLLWWLVLISVSVALINMLPVGIFDGGRFFYLSVLGLVKSEKIARAAFAASTYIVMAMFFALMFFWLISFF